MPLGSSIEVNREQELVIGGRIAPAAGGGSAGITAPAYEELLTGQLVYIRSDGQLALADATTEGKEAVGFCNHDYSQGHQATFYNQGVVEGLSGLVPGRSYFLGLTPGSLGAFPISTGNVIQGVGVALSSSQLIFYLSPPITL